MPRFALIALCVLQLRGGVWALPWIATEYIEVHVSTAVPAGYDTFLSTTVTEILFTEKNTVIPTASTFPALSTVTTINSYYDLTLVDILVPTGVGTTKDYYDTAYTTTTSTYVQFTYTAPARCTPGWVWATSGFVNLPLQITITPTSVGTSTSVLGAFDSTVTQYFGYIDPTDIPEGYRSYLSSRYEPLFSSSCTIPYYYLSSTTSGVSATGSPNYGTPNYGSGSGESSSTASDYSDCIPFAFYVFGTEIGSGYYCDDGTHYTSGVSITNFILIWVFTWFSVFFILGLIESYINFAKLSRGQKARRGMPFMFACLAPLLSCLCLCLRTQGYVARTPEEQAIMRAEWDKTPFGTKLSRWIKWGFRNKYPTFLGDAPARRSKHGQRSQRGANDFTQQAAWTAPPQYNPSGAPAGNTQVSSPPAAAPEVTTERHGDDQITEMRQMPPAYGVSGPDGQKTAV